MKNYLTEALGIFFFVLVIALTVASGRDLALIGIGTALMIVVYVRGLSISNILIYAVGCFGGWILAALQYNMINAK